MNKLILFLRKIHLFVLFLILEIFALIYFSQSSVYTNAKIMNVSNSMIGGIYATLTSTQEYVHLKEKNTVMSDIIVEQLAEIERLNLIQSTYSDSLVAKLDILIDSTRFLYTSAKVINNSVSKQYNYMTISKGAKDGVVRDMAIIHNNTVVGYVAATSDNYSVGITMLNKDFKSSGKDKNNGYFGALYWDGLDYREMILDDIPKYAEVKIGDTIITTSFSPRFPEGINIGVVKEFALTEKMNYKAKIELFTDMSKIYNVVLIHNNYFEEISTLEQNLSDSIAND